MFQLVFHDTVKISLWFLGLVTIYVQQIIVPGVIQEFVGSLYYVISYDGGFHFSEPYILVEGITNTQTVEDPRGVFADDDGGFWMITKIIKVDTVNSLNSLPNVYFYSNDHNGAPNHWKLIYQTTDGNTVFMTIRKLHTVYMEQKRIVKLAVSGGLQTF